MLYYAIGDVHGQIDLLNTALKYIRSKNGKKVIFIGDYIDRGPSSLGVLFTVMNPPSDMEFICLKGNHEDMMVDPYFKYKEFDFYCTKFEKECKGKVDHHIMEWMRDLKLFHFEGENVFAHAYYDATLRPDQQTEVRNLWLRFPMGADYNSVDNLFLSHGHTPFINGPESTANRFNLDCSAKDGKQLCIGIYRENVRGPVGYCMIYIDGSIKENIWS